MNSYLGISKEELIKLGAIHTAEEITNQPKTWLKTLDVIQENHKELESFLKKVYEESNLQIVLTGAGSSAFIGDVLEGIFQKFTGKKANAIATTDLVTHPDYYMNCDGSTLLISFARSGDSPESIRAIELADYFCKNIYHLIITCNQDGQLARNNYDRENAYVLLMPSETNDKGLAMTSSFTSMLLSGLLIARITELNLLNEKVKILCNAGQNFIDKYYVVLRDSSKIDFKRAIFLGSGFLKGIARESHLKLQELTDGNVICKYDTFLGFRHGPKAVINEETLIVYLFANDDYVLKYEKDLVQSLNQGRKALCSIGVMGNNLEGVDVDIKLEFVNNNIDETLLAILYVLPAQILGFYKSLNLGLKPDNPSENGMITRVVQGVKIYPYNK